VYKEDRIQKYDPGRTSCMHHSPCDIFFCRLQPNSRITTKRWK